MTGRRGPISDPKAVGHRPHPELAVISAAPRRPVPRPPDGVTGALLDDWKAYWASPLANAAEDVDLPVVRRLFRLRLELDRTRAAIADQMVVVGSVGQMRVNPLAEYALRVEAMILRLETELGLTPLARMRLGVAIGEAQNTLDKLNERFTDAEDLRVVDGPARSDQPAP